MLMSRLTLFCTDFTNIHTHTPNQKTPPQCSDQDNLLCLALTGMWNADDDEDHDTRDVDTKLERRGQEFDPDRSGKI